MSDFEYQELVVVGLVLDPISRAPVLVLRNEERDVNIPIWIGIAEATAIASIIKKIELDRPLAYDLVINSLTKLNAKIVKVVITEIKETTYFAELFFMQGDKMYSVDCRPSDAVALALKCEIGIYATDSVIEQTINSTRKKLPSSESESEKETKEPENSTIFEEIDKDKWKDILDSLDVDDFKYKI